MNMQELLRQIAAEHTARYTPEEVAALRRHYETIGHVMQTAAETYMRDAGYDTRALWQRRSHEEAQEA